MKKIIINENWEEEIIEDSSNFFVLIFKQGSNAGYIKAFSPNNEEILNKYQELVSQYENTTFGVPANILIIKVPATGQVKSMLDQAFYTGEENNPEQVEILNHLLGRADCEYIGETNLETLEEAKKKKKKRKKRKTPRVTYTTGWPWYNDRMFNHHMGSCDCDKDKDEAGADAADNANDAIGGGESVGDAGSAGGDFGGGDSAGGDGGGMGESLEIKEAVDYYDQIPKMAALEDGTRGFNAKAASDEKLRVNRRVCIDYHYNKALKVIEDEMIRRGLIQPTTTATKPIPYKKAYNPDITALDFQPADIFFIWEHKNDLDSIIDSLTESTARQTLFNLIIYLILAVYLREQSVIEGLKSWIIEEYNMTSAELKDLILKKALNNKEIHNRIIDCINTANSERKK